MNQVILSRSLRKGRAEDSSRLELAKAKPIHQREFKPRCKKGNDRGHMSANGLSLRRLGFKSWLRHRKVMLASQEILMLVVILILMQPPQKRTLKHFLLPFLFLNHKRQRGGSSLSTYAQNPTRQPSSHSRSPRALVGKQQMPRLHEQEGMRITRVNQSEFPSPGATGACRFQQACYPRHSSGMHTSVSQYSA